MNLDRSALRNLFVAGLAVGCGANDSPLTTSSTTAAITSADLKQSPNGGPPSVAPSRLEALRIAGDKEMTPDDDVITAAWKTGQRLQGSFKFCVDESGHVTAVTMLQTTRVASYDEKIIAAMKRWAFRPVVVDGHAITVCSAATFIFSAR